MRDIKALLASRQTKRPTNMPNDVLLSSLCWGDLERALEEIALLPNRHLVKDIVTALWKQSNRDNTELETLSNILAAAVMLADPNWAPCSQEALTMA